MNASRHLIAKDFAFVRTPDGIDGALISRALGNDVRVTSTFDGIGDVHAKHRSRLLSFVDDSSFVIDVNGNPYVTGVFCREEDAPLFRTGIECVIVPEPRWCFFSLMDFLARNFKSTYVNDTGEGSDISNRAYIASHSVRIGRNVRVEAGAYVDAGTIIGDDVVIRANATVGIDGFQHQPTSQGIVSPLHDGVLIVDDGAVIGYGTSISRGFSYRETRIGCSVKIDALAYVAHGTAIGHETIVCTHASGMGHVKVGARSWLGPACVITNRVVLGDGTSVSPGAIVTTDIPSGARFSGNFAIPHKAFLADLKRKIDE